MAIEIKIQDRNGLWLPVANLTITPEPTRETPPSEWGCVACGEGVTDLREWDTYMRGNDDPLMYPAHGWREGRRVQCWVVATKRRDDGEPDVFHTLRAEALAGKHRPRPAREVAKEIGAKEHDAHIPEPRFDPPKDTRHPVERWEAEGPECRDCERTAFLHQAGFPLCDDCVVDIDTDDHGLGAHGPLGLAPIPGAPTRSERIAYEMRRRERAERERIACQGDVDVEGLL